MYICTQLIPLAIKQPFHESTTGQVGTSEYSLAEAGNLCYIAVFWLSAALISFSHCLVC